MSAGTLTGFLWDPGSAWVVTAHTEKGDWENQIICNKGSFISWLQTDRQSVVLRWVSVKGDISVSGFKRTKWGIIKLPPSTSILRVSAGEKNRAITRARRAALLTTYTHTYTHCRCRTQRQSSRGMWLIEDMDVMTLNLWTVCVFICWIQGPDMPLASLSGLTVLLKLCWCSAVRKVITYGQEREKTSTKPRPTQGDYTRQAWKEIKLSTAVWEKDEWDAQTCEACVYGWIVLCS